MRWFTIIPPSNTSTSTSRACTCIIPLACTLWGCLFAFQSEHEANRSKYDEEEPNSKAQDYCQDDFFVHDGGLSNQEASSALYNMSSTDIIF